MGDCDRLSRLPLSTKMDLQFMLELLTSRLQRLKLLAEVSLCLLMITMFLVIMMMMRRRRMRTQKRRRKRQIGGS